MNRKMMIAAIMTAMIAVSAGGCGNSGNGGDAAGPEEVKQEQNTESGAEAGQESSSEPEAADTQSQNEQEPAAQPESAQDGSGSGAAAEEGGKPMVALVTTIGGIEDESFNQGAWNGIERLSGAADCETKFIESMSEGDFRVNLEKVVADGADLSWGVGYGCAEALLETAAAHPEASFAIVDGYYENTPDNVTGVMFRAQEPSFLVGYIAANTTETGKVGFVGGETNEVIDQFQYGYQAGVAYAAKELGKKIEVEAVYADTFTDPAKGRELASELFGSGCDVVYHAAGETGLGVINAAAEAGKYAIGVDKDQSYLAPENVLTSAMKYVNVAVLNVSKDYLAGEKIGGKTISLGLAENAVGVSEQHDLYSDELYDTMLSIADDIIAGKITPPANETEYNAFVSEL